MASRAIKGKWFASVPVRKGRDGCAKRYEHLTHPVDLLVHAAFAECACGRRCGKAAECAFSKLEGKGIAHAPHGFNGFVEIREVANARERDLRRYDCVGDARGVALLTGRFDQACDGVAHQAHEPA